MQLLVELIMNALYGEFLRKDITESYHVNQKLGCEQNMMREF